MKFFLPVSLAAVAAGFFNGLLGAGGGVLLVLAFSAFKSGDGQGAYANALAVMLPLSLLTLLGYTFGSTGEQLLFSEKAVEFLPFLLGALVGGALGGIILSKLSTKKAKKLFAVLTFISGMLMLFR